MMNRALIHTDSWLILVAVFILSSCAIRDDIPYPIVEAQITSFEVEGQCNETDDGFAEARIDKVARTIDVHVSDTVNLSRLRLLRFGVSNDAKGGFVAGEVLDCSRGNLTCTLTTYQNYEWTIHVSQVILREVQIDGQVGDAVIDPINRSMIAYVASTQKLGALAVRKFTLGGQHGKVLPDPTEASTFDFSRSRNFTVIPANTGIAETWHVFVYTTDAKEEATATAFGYSVSALITGTVPVGTTPVVEFREATGAADWIRVNPNQVKVSSRNFEAEPTGLRPNTTYEYRVTAGSSVTAVQTFTTAGNEQLENSSFDEWSISGTANRALYQPWGEGQPQYWDTGNHGATTVGASNSTYVDEGGRRYANLQSKYIVIKFAAGNIFTGQYVKTDGTNGILSFGRPFTSFPTKMRFDYKYQTSTINRTGGDWKENYGNYITRELYEGLKGKPDSCNVYIALGDWEPVTFEGVECPYLIRTRPSELHLFDFNDPHLIAYASLTKGENVSAWTTETLTLNYRVRNRRPRYVIVVASSSKYGDYFTGGDASLLQLDNIELLYE